MHFLQSRLFTLEQQMCYMGNKSRYCQDLTLYTKILSSRNLNVTCIGKIKRKCMPSKRKFTWKYCNIHLLQCFVWKCVDYATFGKTTLTITRVILTFFFVKIGKTCRYNLLKSRFRTHLRAYTNVTLQLVLFIKQNELTLENTH